MSHIVLNDEQAKVVAAALQPLPVRDGNGNLLGFFSLIGTQEDIAHAKQVLAAREPGHTTEQVLQRLRSLEQQ